jgi:hypothetical protein
MRFGRLVVSPLRGLDNFLGRSGRCLGRACGEVEMRTDDEFKDSAAIPDEATGIPDWLNLRPGSRPLSLWDSLHDAEVISIRSSLLQRTMELILETRHLRDFFQLGEGFRFLFHLEGVQSARAIHWAMWPGEFSVPPGVSRSEETKLISEYQAKWREESASWSEFDVTIALGSKQIFCIHDAAILALDEGIVALKLCGQLNHSKYHEIFLRADTLRISGNNESKYTLNEFRKLGETYWARR